MSLRRGPGIITEGLIFYADAANPKSYVSGSTTTNNLTNLSEIGDLENGTHILIKDLGYLMALMIL